MKYPIDKRGEMQDDTGSHHVSTMRQLSKPRKRASKTKKPTQKATVTVLATDVNTISANTFGTSLMNDRILRIKKCLVTGNHAETQVSEAEAALRLASILMSKCNVTQAEAFAYQDEKEQALHAGESVVAVTSTKDGKKVISNGWISEVQHAIQTFFDCKSYSEGFVSKIEYTFFGIVANTAAAAMAFEMVYNLILHWSMLKIGVSTKFSYCTGVAQGLYRLAVKEKLEEEKNSSKTEAEILAQREREELEQRDREIDRLNYNPVSYIPVVSVVLIFLLTFERRWLCPSRKTRKSKTLQPMMIKAKSRQEAQYPQAKNEWPMIRKRKMRRYRISMEEWKIQLTLSEISNLRLISFAVDR